MVNLAMHACMHAVYENCFARLTMLHFIVDMQKDSYLGAQKVMV